MRSLYDSVKRVKPKVWAGSMRRCFAEILSNRDDRDLSEPLRWLEEAIEEDERNGMRFDFGRDLALYAELFKRKGDRIKAKEQLGKAIEIYRECGADGWVTKAEEELARMS